VQVGLQLMPAGALVTVPVPVPASVIVRATAAALNVAVTAFAAVIVTTHDVVPVHAPLQPANVEPADGVAVSDTCVPVAKFATHALGQLMPAGLLVTVPVPVPASVTVRAAVVDALNVAVTASAALIVTTHEAVPVHAPLQPANAEPVEAVGVSVTCVPAAKFAAQVVGQLIPVGALVTVPAPDPASVTVSAKLVAAPIVAVTLAELFCMLGSGKSDTTVAELAKLPVAFAFTVTTITRVALPAFATVPRLHVSVVVPVQAEPCDGVADTSVAFVGKVSVMVVFVASSGPAFATVSVYVWFDPAGTVPEACVIANDRSAETTLPFLT